jgi:hypothetical protein
MAKEKLEPRQLKELARTTDRNELRELEKDKDKLKEVAKHVDKKYMEKVAIAVARQHKIAKDSADEPSGEAVRRRCTSICELSVHHSGEVFALVNCGKGTCSSCPPGLGNLIVKNWCAYHSVSSDRQAIVFHLVFGGTLGPFLV